MTQLQEMALRKPVVAMAPLEAATVKGIYEAVDRVQTRAESRQAKWKRLHPEKVREAQKLLMRKRRAKP